MKHGLFLLAFLGFAASSGMAAAQGATELTTPGPATQEIVSPQGATQIVAPGATVTTAPGASVTTIVETPTETTTTKVTSTGGASQFFKLRDGQRMEVDSDNSAYIVYDDGARITAPDGIHTLLGGATVTVKDGKRIP